MFLILEYNSSWETKKKVNIAENARPGILGTDKFYWHLFNDISIMRSFKIGINIIAWIKEQNNDIRL